MHNRIQGRGARLLTMVALCALAFAAFPAGPAGAGGFAGNDISWPQCGRSLPSGGGFGIVGVNDGKPYTGNPCLATEYRWASSIPTGLPAAFYMNTANPGPNTTALNWYGQHSPNPSCSPANQVACAYNYGWNAARDAYAYANSKGSAGPGHAWWLDVETGNTWSGDQAANLGDVLGSVEYLASRRVVVGIYSTRYQWTLITGGASIPGLPNWAAGARNAAEASGFCATKSFTGGPVLLAQWVQGQFDYDWACPGADAVLHPSVQPPPASAGQPKGLALVITNLLKRLLGQH